MAEGAGQVQAPGRVQPGIIHFRLSTNREAAAATGVQLSCPGFATIRVATEVFNIILTYGNFDSNAMRGRNNTIAKLSQIMQMRAQGGLLYCTETAHLWHLYTRP